MLRPVPPPTRVRPPMPITLLEDVTVDQLALAEQLALWASRQWVQMHRTRDPDMARLARPFALIGATTAAGQLDNTLTAMAAGLSRPMTLACPTCPRVAADESILLLAVGCGRPECRPLAERLLASFLLPSARRCAAEGLHAFVAELEAAGLTFPRRLPASTLAWITPSAGGPRLVH